jgi:hypothetical protein
MGIDVKLASGLFHGIGKNRLAFLAVLSRDSKGHKQNYEAQQ